MLNRSLLRGGWAEIFDSPNVKCALESALAALAEDQREYAPAADEVFAAFYLTPLDRVKAVIIGQDPYHSMRKYETNPTSKYHAHGLCFSVKRSARFIPPSLHNIYSAKPLRDQKYGHGSLVNWALQGVLMLNTSLTVAVGKANSHQFWVPFTDMIIAELAKKPEIVYMLWGNFAQSKAKLLGGDARVLTWRHPSPLSNNPVRGTDKEFKCCNHFEAITDIDWANLDDLMLVMTAKGGHTRLDFETISDSPRIFNFAEEGLNMAEMFAKYLPVIHCADVKVIKLFAHDAGEYAELAKNAQLREAMCTIEGRQAALILVDDKLSDADRAILERHI